MKEGAREGGREGVKEGAREGGEGGGRRLQCEQEGEARVCQKV